MHGDHRGSAQSALVVHDTVCLVMQCIEGVPAVGFVLQDPIRVLALQLHTDSNFCLFDCFSLIVE